AITALASDLEQRVELLIERFLDTALADHAIPALPKPDVKVLALAKELATIVPTIIKSTLTGAFSDLVSRTGRLVFDHGDGTAGCDLLPQHGLAQLGVPPAGGLFLQAGFSRQPLAIGTAFPVFAPSDLLDAQVDLDPSFVLDLLCCMLEKVPGLA